jgi:hypothetical protein
MSFEGNCSSACGVVKTPTMQEHKQLQEYNTPNRQYNSRPNGQN